MHIKCQQRKFRNAKKKKQRMILNVDSISLSNELIESSSVFVCVSAMCVSAREGRCQNDE